MRALVVSAMLIAASAPMSAGAVTDCGKPRKTNIEMLLCSNERLARADNLMALAFRDAFRRTEDPEALRSDQQRWTREVRDACNDVPCLMRVLEDRASALQTWRPPR